MKKNGNFDKKEEEEKLWQAYWKDRSTERRNCLILYYSWAVVLTAEQLKRKLPNKVEVMDLINEGHLVLAEIIGKFDPLQKVKFTSFAYNRIRGAMYDYLRKNDWVPKDFRRKIAKIGEAKKEFQKIYGREPSRDELVSLVKVRPEILKRWWGEIETGIPFISTTDCELVEMEDFSPAQWNKESEASREFRRKECVEELRRVLAKLSWKERIIITGRYFEDQALQDIGKTLGLSRERIRQIQRNALKKMLQIINLEHASLVPEGRKEKGGVP